MKLGLELALEPGPARVQELVLQVAALAQALAQAQLEPQVRAQLEQHLQRSHPKPQLHRHRCKAPDRIQEPQLELRQTQAHPKALDMTPRVLMLALELQEIVQQKPVLELA